MDQKAPKRYRILVLDGLSPKGMELLAGEPRLEVTNSPTLDPVALQQTIGDYHGVIVRSATKLTADILEHAQRVRLLCRAGIGVDNIDLDAATRKGIVVMNSPGGNVVTTAEHTLSMLLALSRNIPQAVLAMRAGRWERKKFTGVEVYRKVLGVIGLGRIGSVVARLALGIGMQVIGYDPYISRERVESLGIEVVSFEEVLRRCDYLTLHTPMTEETRSLIGAKELAQMKHGVRIINCARGGLVHEAALLEALQSGKVAGAALDVFEQEPPPPAHPLVNHPAVICTPHLGAATEEAQDRIAVDVAQQTIDFFLHGQIRNAVNVPSIDAESYQRIKPFLALAEKLGRFQAQLAEGGVQEVSIQYSGEVAGYDTKWISLTLLNAVLTTFLGDTVNVVNAGVVARNRGIRIVESSSSEAEDYTSLISVTITTDVGAHTMSGTIVGKRDERVILIDGYRIEVVPHGHLLIVRNEDQPGVIGRIGTILGRNGLNIGGMHLGRLAPHGQAMCILAVDSPIPQSVIDEILQYPPFISVNAVTL